MGRSIEESDELAERLAAETPRLVRLATRLVRNPAEAGDLVGETVIIAWRARSKLRDPAALPAWLRRSLVNRVIDRSRRMARVAELDFDAVAADWRDDDFTVDPVRVLERAELHEELEDGLVHVPIIYRTAIVLHDALGWPASEISETLRIGLPAAKQRIRRGRMMLVNALAADDARRRASLAQPMRCWRARRLVSAYLDQELDLPKRTAVEQHLASCPTCPPLYASLVGIRNAMGSLRDPDTVVADAAAERIRALLASRIG